VILSHDNGSSSLTSIQVINQQIYLFHNGSFQSVPLNPGLYSDQWTHVVVSFDTTGPGSVRFVLRNNSFGPRESFDPGPMTWFPLTYTQFRIGSGSASSNYNGRLDDLRIFIRSSTTRRLMLYTTRDS
jgi:hypothetical protein